MTRPPTELDRAAAASVEGTEGWRRANAQANLDAVDERIASLPAGTVQAALDLVIAIAAEAKRSDDVEFGQAILYAAECAGLIEEFAFDVLTPEQRLALARLAGEGKDTER